VRKLAVLLAVVAMLSLTCAVFAQAKSHPCCVKAGACAAHKDAVAKCAACKEKGLCEKDAKALADCKECKKDAKCEKCSSKKH